MPLHLDATGIIIVRLLGAAALGGAVGLEREIHGKPAGLRTSMFICLGSALFTILSGEIARRFGDTSGTRIASNLIPGIGFLGAGAIIRGHGSVVGLTTAATIFVLAAVGMAVGGGMYVIAVATVLIILMSLIVLGWIEDWFGLKTRLTTFRLTTARLEEVMSHVQQILEEAKVAMQHFQVFRIGTEFVMEFDADVSHAQQRHIIMKFSALNARCEIVPLDSPRE